MARLGNEQHEEVLRQYIENSQNKIIDLKGKCPDAIEVYYDKGELKVRAVEVLPIRWMKGQARWQKTFTHKQKEEAYRMFDEVKIITYKNEASKNQY